MRKDMTICEYFEGEIKKLENRIIKLETDMQKLSAKQIAKETGKYSKRLLKKMGLK